MSAAIVYGAGVAGLTAAHELVERGWRVAVIERAGALEGRPDCDVGGLAASQAAYQPLDPGGPLRPAIVAPDLADRPLRCVGGAAALTDTSARHLACLAARLRAAADAQGLSKLAIEVTGRADPGHRPAGGASARGGPLDLALARARAAADALSALLEPGASAAPFRTQLADPGRRFCVRVRGLAPAAAIPDEDGAYRAEEAPEHRRVTLRLAHPRLDGEHGFRFFPAFYHHVFDTMGRIPIGGGRTVLDRLVALPRVGIAGDDGRPPATLLRRRPDSLAALYEQLEVVRERFGAADADLARYALKMLKFMTAGPSRRRAWEDIPWWDYVGGDGYSPGFQGFLAGTTRLLVALSARHGDARTVGAINLQLLFDFGRAGECVDRMLDAPTSEAWLAPWRAHLEAWGVRFYRGELEAVEVVDGRARLRLRGGAALDPISGESVDFGALLAEMGSAYHVLAVDALSAKALLAGLPDPPRDARRLRDWDIAPIRGAASPAPDRPMQSMVGIQYFSRRRVGLGETCALFTDSPWAVSAVNQSELPRTRTPGGPLSTISVDVSDWGAPAPRVPPAPTPSGGGGWAGRPGAATRRRSRRRSGRRFRTVWTPSTPCPRRTGSTSTEGWSSTAGAKAARRCLAPTAHRFW